MRKDITKISAAIVVVLTIAFIYTSVPRVMHHSSPVAANMQHLLLLPDTSKAALINYINDPEQHYSKDQQIVALKDDKLVFEYGDTKKLVNCHSARKSIMSLLIGIAKEKDFLRLDETLAEIGIDESKTPLTKQEKSATIKDLLMARCGVYLPAEAETDFAKANRPKREQYKPGEFFFYNNFDFNVLGAILEKKTGKSIGEFMNEYLAKPLGLQDYSPTNIVYGNPWPMRDDKSDYRVYWIYLSAPRFGTDWSSGCITGTEA